MTELQQVVWAGLGVVAVLLLKWLFDLMIYTLKKGKKLQDKADDDQLNRIERKVDAIDLRSRATVGALGSMNTLPELDFFSKQFRDKFKDRYAYLKENPEYEDFV